MAKKKKKKQIPRADIEASKSLAYQMSRSCRCSIVPNKKKFIKSKDRKDKRKKFFSIHI